MPKRTRSDEEESDSEEPEAKRGEAGGSFQGKYGGNEETAESMLEGMLKAEAAPPMMQPPMGVPGGFTGVTGMPGGPPGGPGGGLWFAGGGKGGGKHGGDMMMGTMGGPCFTCGGDHVARECPQALLRGNLTLNNEPRIETTQMDFTKLNSQMTSQSSVVVQKKLVEPLMTPESRRLLTEESGCAVEWKPDEATVMLSGSQEQVKRAQRLLARVMMHSRWGYSEEKVRRLLKPRKAESVLCRLSPMNTLQPVQKLLSAQQKTLSIGKEKGNDSLVRNAIVSRRHVVLELDCDRGAVYILDCSTNGTYLNGIRLPSKQGGKVLVSHGDEMLLKDPGSGEQDFGYIINLTELRTKEETKLEAPRRILTAEEISSNGRDVV